MTYEYCITVGPGTLVDVGEIHGVETVVFPRWNSRMGEAWNDITIYPMLLGHLMKGHSILIGPVEYEGDGETLRLKGE